MYFTNDGFRYWKTDGTSAGTVMVPLFQNTEPVVFGNDVYYIVSDGKNGFDLWTGDGTQAGTHLIADVTGTAQAPIVGLSVAAVLGGVTLLFADNPGSIDLYATDGTTAGTIRLTQVPFGQVTSQDSIQIGNTYYFAANYGDAAEILWKSDGTAGRYDEPRGQRSQPGQ